MPRLHLTTGDKLRIVELGPLNTIGRRPHNTIQLDDKALSSSHCVIELRGKEYVLRDAGSSSGTYVNDKRVTEHALRNGDQISAGFVRARFEAEEDLAWLKSALGRLHDVAPGPNASHELLRAGTALFEFLQALTMAIAIEPKALDHLRVLRDRVAAADPEDEAFESELLVIAERVAEAL